MSGYALGYVRIVVVVVVIVVVVVAIFKSRQSTMGLFSATSTTRSELLTMVQRMSKIWFITMFNESRMRTVGSKKFGVSMRPVGAYILYLIHCSVLPVEVCCPTWTSKRWHNCRASTGDLISDVIWALLMKGLSSLSFEASFVRFVTALTVYSHPVVFLQWQRRDKGGWRPEVDEEFEDEDGNVYSKKTYEDVKRQGLIP